MKQQEFNDLSKRYLEGKTTPKEEQFLMQWLENQPKEQPLPFTHAQKLEIENRISKNINQQISPFSKHLKNRIVWLSSIAAAACLIVGIFWLNGQNEDTNFSNNLIPLSENEEKVGIVLKNTTSTEQEVKLEDGTVVLLNQNSSLVYDKTFNRTKREVFLKGEAFFKVKRDISKPFIVHTGKLITEVLGTSFRIKQNDAKSTIEVSVTSGKVSVYANKNTQNIDKNGVILTPNQKVMYDESSKNLIPSIVEIPVPIFQVEKTTPKLIFQLASLQSVLNSLTQLYGIEFVITNPLAKDCHITADLNGLSMFTQIELICKSIDANYEKRGTVVFINGDGCQK